jgi:hypothetical protein
MKQRNQATRFALLSILALAAVILYCAGSLIAGELRPVPDLTAHEWGTFTAIAGPDGRAREWTVFYDPAELPEFVERFNNMDLKVGLHGTIRMETPVLYFYSPRDVSVSVKVAFSKGVITEWYPRAARVQPRSVLQNASLSTLNKDGTITWNDVAVSPNLNPEFTREASANRYYTARDTASTPLSVKTTAGTQKEKFLFYRGVSAAALPLTATQDPSGQLLVRNLKQNEIPAVILFERRGSRVGYRWARALSDETVLDPPELTGNLDSLCADLESVLAEQGLFPDEAHAMVQTWRDSWFEEGSRLIYIVPREFVDGILPLAITPAPEQLIRVFVGRLEIVTPATAKAVETAFAAHDEQTLDQYKRFLQPILQIASETHRQPTQESRNRATASGGASH